MVLEVEDECQIQYFIWRFIIKVRRYRVMLTRLALFLLFVILSVGQDCFGSDCKHRSPVLEMKPVDPIQVGRQIEAELRKQYWYYLKDSTLIYQANLNMPHKLMIFYFHRNIVGTFFTICSWHFESTFSEVNTLVRLGSGSQANVAGGSQPVSIDPFVLTLKLADGESRVEFN